MIFWKNGQRSLKCFRNRHCVLRSRLWRPGTSIKRPFGFFWCLVPFETALKEALEIQSPWWSLISHLRAPQNLPLQSSHLSTTATPIELLQRNLRPRTQHQLWNKSNNNKKQQQQKQQETTTKTIHLQKQPKKLFDHSLTDLPHPLMGTLHSHLKWSLKPSKEPFPPLLAAKEVLFFPTKSRPKRSKTIQTDTKKPPQNNPKSTQNHKNHPTKHPKTTKTIQKTPQNHKNHPKNTPKTQKPSKKPSQKAPQKPSHFKSQAQAPYVRCATPPL